MNHDDTKKILIIGVKGGLAQITAGLLLKKYPNLQIIGVDPREVPKDRQLNSSRINYLRLSYSRSGFERLFRSEKFDAVLHLGRMSHSGINTSSSLAKKLDLNIMGTKRILDLSLKFKVKKVILLSTFHVYGAFSDNPVFIKEDALLKASIHFPELRDVVEMDQIATNWMWKNQKYIQTVVLRPCNIIGPQILNTMTKYLTSPLVPVPLDYNPMLQFIHEFDMATIIARSIKELPTGIYNSAPSDHIPLRGAKDLIGVPYSRAPIFLLQGIARLLNKSFWTFPDYLIEYVKFPAMLDNTALKRHLGDDFTDFSTTEALKSLQKPFP